MPQQDTGYPPLNTPKPVAEGVWIVDAPPIHPAGLPMPLRMSVVRLADGDLLLYSPTQFSPELKAALERLGPIRHLVAPSIAHWMFLREWQQACPETTSWGVPGLRSRAQVRKAGVRIDHELGDHPPAVWGAEIGQVIIRGNAFVEVDLFHRPSRTLLMTDLVINLEPDRLPPPAQAVGRLLGIVAPEGRAAAYVRALVRLNRRQTAVAAKRLVGFAPERVIFSHGRWFDREATAQLKRALSWLVEPARDLDGLAVVITGASSGIGRAAALAFAARGCNLVLAARRAELLEEVARECRGIGVAALAVPTDVTDPAAVAHLARAAEASFARIDVWINNAGTGVFGPYQDAGIELHRRTVEVNLFGAMHGASAVLPLFLRQGHGTLINNISMGGWAPTPFSAAYTASKFGLRGFTASLRQELAPHPGVHVCAVFPAMIDTPGFVHGANVSGCDLDPGPLLYTAEDVAETFVDLVRTPGDEVAVGWPARLAQASYAVARLPTERLVAAAVRGLLSRAKPHPRTEGAVLAPVDEGQETSGGWLARRKLPSARLLTRGMLAAGAVGVGAAVLVGAGRRSRGKAQG